MKRGEVWLIDLGLAAKARPAVILSVPFEDNEKAVVTYVARSLQRRGSRGSFGNPTGGGRRCVELRIVFESAGLFHGEVINAGSRCHRDAGGIVPFHYNCCRVRCPQRIMQREQPASSMR